MPITFDGKDLEGLDLTHNDPLVVELLIGESEVTRILIDTGSSVNVIFRDVLAKMEVGERDIMPECHSLTGFDGDHLMSVGTITLPIFVGGIARYFRFAVIDKPTIYNVILGTPWLHKMKAQSKQRVSDDSASPTDGKPTAVQQGVAAVEEVNLDENDKKRCVNIGTEITAAMRNELILFLKANISMFAWSVTDMKGIDPSVTTHELNADPTHKPVKQKRRKLGPERSQAENDEVDKLLGAGSIVEVKYPEWLANPVVVKKKNGKWRVCVDFTDLNKACPKDSFPLPRIDQLVEATAGNNLLTFMDAFSGYNQILMHDQEKTSFITDRGTYCYKVMPFGLKNAGATYQRLVNKMFAEQLGRTMEVYIDDMLVKSQRAKDHITHLRQCFDTLNKYGMKLNPAKCTFAVKSGEFLGYLVTRRGIEANPKQIKAIIDLPLPKNAREVQRLTGRIAALNRFISRSTDKCLPFYQLLKTKESAVSDVLVKDDREEQRPVFYISKSLDDAETRYPTDEKVALAVITSARKLRPYFQSHIVAVLSNQPLRSILHSPNQSGRLTKWAIELSEYDIEYRTRPAAKSQVLANFLIELPFGEAEPTPIDPSDDRWILHVDGASSHLGSGVGIRLTSPTGEILEQSFRLRFQATNNVAEYEALIAGLKLANGMQIKRIRAFCDSQLVANQFSGEYDTKSEPMAAYLDVVRILSKRFDEFELIKIPRGDNAPADALAALASTSDPDLR
ncbi:PREDICTED: uncharacterized protein LOC109127059 [Camelina sativa]|uniref:RNA-directed DNA polymerase n=1 Tax=Camelina sativa TaxID=90675 RepID=A0ABM1QJ86_CAMSA|nr:PREDICTED: uncharacterized protein LOC109127059 [Camelina sativa]